jgi:hypothetical protein
MLWDDIYGLPALPEVQSAWAATQDIVDRLGDPDAILSVPATAVSRLQNQVAEASTLWQQARIALDTHLREHRETWEREIALLDGIAEIPDLLNASEREEVNQLTNAIRSLLRPELPSQSTGTATSLAAEWRQKTERYQSLRQQLSFEAIGKRYNLSPESSALLQQLTERKRVSLAQISPQTLSELQRFQRLCAAVTLRFSASA